MLCKNLFTRIWLLEVSSKTPKSLIKSGAFTPAAHTMISASICSSSFVIKPYFVASFTCVCSRTWTPSFNNSRLALDAIRSGKAGKMRGPASIKWMCKRFGDIFVKPYSFNRLDTWYSSAESSTPVAPPPTMAILSACCWLSSWWRRVKPSSNECWKRWACWVESKK